MKHLGMNKALLAIIFAYLFAALLYYIVFFGRMAQEGDFLDRIFIVIVATISLAGAIFLSYTYIIANKTLKVAGKLLDDLPSEDSSEGQEALLKEAIIFDILKLENPDDDFSPKAIMNLKEFFEKYEFEKRFSDKSVEELRGVRDRLLK